MDNFDIPQPSGRRASAAWPTHRAKARRQRQQRARQARAPHKSRTGTRRLK